MKHRCMEEDQHRGKKDNLADLAPPPLEDDDISALSESPCHPLDFLEDISMDLEVSAQYKEDDLLTNVISFESMHHGPKHLHLLSPKMVLLHLEPATQCH
jgi:hypothetical protein